MQLETPLNTIETAATLAKASHCKVILNPAPAQHLPASLLAKIDVITPNETEAHWLTGITVTDSSSAHDAAVQLREHGVGTVIITLGDQGAYLLDDTHDELVPGFNVKAVDTTAAGDTFNGALAVALGQGQTMKTATQFANAAAALSVTQAGAQPSVPYLKDVEAFLADAL
jgi:ribokinase